MVGNAFLDIGQGVGLARAGIGKATVKDPQAIGNVGEVK
jgi:hypothetical protein